MSTHLLPLAKPNPDIMKYVRLDISSNIVSSVIAEYGRELYIGVTMDNSIFRIIKMNLITMAITTVVDIAGASIGSYPVGGMLVDNDYIYIKTATSSGYIYRYSFETNEIISFFSGTNNAAALSRLLWYDNQQICYVTQAGYVLFNTKTTSFNEVVTSSFTPNDFCIGEKFVMLTRANASLKAVRLIRKEDGSTIDVDLSISGINVPCYDATHKLFYIAQSNLITVFDETSESICNTIPIPINTPRSIDYNNGALFITQMNGAVSNMMFVYDVDKALYDRIYLPWNLPSSSSYHIRPFVFGGYYFLQYITLGIMSRLDGGAKYKLGNKYDQKFLLYNKSTKNGFTYDANVFEFTDTCVTLRKDVRISKPLIADTDNPMIKHASINKSDYSKIKSISFYKE